MTTCPDCRALERDVRDLRYRLTDLQREVRELRMTVTRYETPISDLRR